MKKILIVGTSQLQLPAIIKAKELGYYVIGLDRDNNSTGKAFCDSFYCISTLDKDKVLEVAEKENINGIFTMATDRPMTTVAYVGKRKNLNTDSEEVIFNCTNKIQMRLKLAEANIRIPIYRVVNDFNEFRKIIKDFDRTFIVKSSDNSGKRGIYVVKNIFDNDELNYAFNYAMMNSLDKRILVEELLEGTEFSVESITHESETEIIAITRKKNTGKPRFVEIQHSQPSELNEEISDKIKAITKAAIKALGVKNNPSHTEVMVVNGDPYIIELGARLGGDYITSHLVPLSTGYDIVKESIKNAMGYKPLKFIDKNHASLIHYLEAKEGIYMGIKNDEYVRQMKGVFSLEVFKKKGDLIKKYENSNDRIGCIIIEGENMKEVYSILDAALSKIEIEVS